MSVYDPTQYQIWDIPRRVTTIPETPSGCIPGTMSGSGTCNSEYWASMARYGRLDTCQGEQYVLDILYINDFAPGGCIQTESGVWTVNPVMWMQAPCRALVPSIDYGDDAGYGFGICYDNEVLILGPTDVDTAYVNMYNQGTLDNHYTAEIFVDSSNSITNGANTTLEVSPTSGVITPGGPFWNSTETLSIIMSANDEMPISTVYGHLVITHEGPGSPRNIPICITISTAPWPPQSYTLQTTCKQLRIYAHGEMSNGGSNQSLDYTMPNDPDDCAEIYLYDGSPIICHNNGGEPRSFFTVFDNSYESDHAFRVTSSFEVDDTVSDSFIVVSSEFVTADSSIGLQVTYYAPTLEEDCEFIIKKVRYWNLTEVTLTNVAVGEYIDWDIPSYQSGSANTVGFDPVRRLIYQSCQETEFTDECDTLVPCQRYAGIATPENEPMSENYIAIENDIYVYSSGPFGNDAPLPDDTIYGLMTGCEGYTPAPIDTAEDMSTLVTFNVIDLLPSDTMCAMMILATSRNDAGGGNLKATIDAANDFIDEHADIINCYNWITCFCRPGDANGDESVDVGDAVYIISYIFKSGPEPVDYAICAGDPNASCQCDVGDAVYLINYIFKGGPVPYDCWNWITPCGYPPH